MKSHGLRLQRRFPVPAATVFRALTDPAELVRWWGPPDFHPTASVDLREGGAYRLGMTLPGRRAIATTGVYREVQPPARLAFTWHWEGDREPETRVEIDLQEQAGSTELTLAHGGFAGTFEVANHMQGWTDCLARLARLLTTAPS